MVELGCVVLGVQRHPEQQGKKLGEAARGPDPIQTCVCVCVIESLYCIPESLQINYTSI